MIAESQRLLTQQATDEKTDVEKHRYLSPWMLIVSVAALSILAFAKSALLPMLNFAMIMAFVTTPVFALLNYILVTRTPLPESLTLGPKMKLLSITGLIYLFGFLALFLWWKWFM
ncbi:hypothetical protein BQ6471_00577 [Vibrio gazogenes]|nr:hypothetical protein BQ6471_00577 [Vibrio gazogenes]